jgi:hypothetical protein
VEEMEALIVLLLSWWHNFSLAPNKRLTSAAAGARLRTATRTVSENGLACRLSSGFQNLDARYAAHVGVARNRLCALVNYSFQLDSQFSAKRLR